MTEPFNDKPKDLKTTAAGVASGVAFGLKFLVHTFNFAPGLDSLADSILAVTLPLLGINSCDRKSK